jgi:hypothetical protein
VSAIRAAGKTGKVQVVGYDNINAIKPMLKDGRVLATADQFARSSRVRHRDRPEGRAEKKPQSAWVAWSKPRSNWSPSGRRPGVFSRKGLRRAGRGACLSSFRAEPSAQRLSLPSFAR